MSNEYRVECTLYKSWGPYWTISVIVKAKNINKAGKKVSIFLDGLALGRHLKCVIGRIESALNVDHARHSIIFHLDTKEIEDKHDLMKGFDAFLDEKPHTNVELAS